MKSVLHHVHHHIRHHHKKYLFGVFGGFAIIKMFLLFLGLGIVEHTHHSTFAQMESGCIFTGAYITGLYQTGGYITGQELTGGYFVDCVTGGGYFTGGFLDENNQLTGQIRVDEYQTGCVLTGQELTGGYWTGRELTGGYLTGGYRTGCFTQQSSSVVLGNGICEPEDILGNMMLSGSIFRNIFSHYWSYSGTDCRLSGLILQLRDHNNQWITLGIIASGVTSFDVDSRRLYSFQLSGLYHIIGTGTSGQTLYMYTGTYTGIYTRLWTGYRLQLLSPSQTVLYETPVFTIDNEFPVLTGIILQTSGFASGYVGLSGIVTLTFVASEELSGMQVTLGSGKQASSSVVSGLIYSYIRSITPVGYPEGPLVVSINFGDKAGNTGSVYYTSSLIFDMTKPSFTGITFAPYVEGVYLNISSSEPIKYEIVYRQSGSTGMFSGSSQEYTLTHQINFTSLTRDIPYFFSYKGIDRAGNERMLTGGFLLTNTGSVISHYAIVYSSGEMNVTGSLATLALTLKNEIEKFNSCKNTLQYTPVEFTIGRNVYTLSMPVFTKSYVKKLVHAFTLFILHEVKDNNTLSSEDREKITKKFNNFLVVLKLLRDDDNACKQNLSNYYINQFKQVLQEYHIELD